MLIFLAGIVNLVIGENTFAALPVKCVAILVYTTLDILSNKVIEAHVLHVGRSIWKEVVNEVFLKDLGGIRVSFPNFHQLRMVSEPPLSVMRP